MDKNKFTVDHVKISQVPSGDAEKRLQRVYSIILGATPNAEIQQARKSQEADNDTDEC